MSKGTQGKFNAQYVYECGMRAGLREASQNQHIARTQAQPRSDKYSRSGVAGAYSRVIARKKRAECRSGMKAWSAAHEMRRAKLAVK